MYLREILPSGNVTTLISIDTLNIMNLHPGDIISFYQEKGHINFEIYYFNYVESDNSWIVDVYGKRVKSELKDV